MHREIGARLPVAMKDKGVDVLFLLGNGNVVYATGASWPLLMPACLMSSNRWRSSSADDEHPHLSMPFHEGSAWESELPTDHVHRSACLEFEEGVQHFARRWPISSLRARRLPSTKSSGTMRNRKAFPGGPPSDTALVVGPAKLVTTLDQITCIRRAYRIAEEAVVEVQKSLVPGPIRSTCRRSSFDGRSNSALPRTCSRPSGR